MRLLGTPLSWPARKLSMRWPSRSSATRTVRTPEPESLLARFIEVRATIGKICHKLLDSPGATRLEPAFGKIMSALGPAFRRRLAETPGGATQARAAIVTVRVEDCPPPARRPESWLHKRAPSHGLARMVAPAVTSVPADAHCAHGLRDTARLVCRCGIAARPAVERDKD